MSRGWIQTFMGHKFTPLAPRAEDVDIVDIAHALGNTCRFGGHCRQFYSVAQHCVNVANTLPSHLQLHGLLHDAAEAYLCDLPSPVKRDADMVTYRAAEMEIMAKIWERFGLSYGEPPEVKRADFEMFEIEAWSLFPEDNVRQWESLQGRPEPKERINAFLSPLEARLAFLQMFQRLA